MLDAIHHLNYVAVIVTAIVGFIVGMIWYMPLFGRAYMAEMKINPEDAKKTPMVPAMAKGFFWTLVSTIGLAILIQMYGPLNRLHGAEFGAMIAILIVGGRKLNDAVWDKKSCKLLSINIGHEIVLFAVQGAILAVWH